MSALKSDEFLVTEIFKSIQGETSLSGVPFVFIRLTGCNLRCTYCDTAYAFKGKNRLNIDSILKTIQPWKIKNVLLTGGEPLLQRNLPALIEALKNNGYQVSIETHGEISIASVATSARMIMDIKTPGSAMCREGFWANIPYLKETDEIKFVLTNEDDYNWSRKIVDRLVATKSKARKILFSPIQIPPGSMKLTQDVARRLVDEPISEPYTLILQTQLHKTIWGHEKTGV